jgi:hypothetical protein
VRAPPTVLIESSDQGPPRVTRGAFCACTKCALALGRSSRLPRRGVTHMRAPLRNTEFQYKRAISKGPKIKVADDGSESRLRIRVLRAEDHVVAAVPDSPHHDQQDVIA